MSPSEISPAIKDLLSRRDEHLGRQGDAPELRGKNGTGVTPCLTAEGHH
jgi:hypothetical protein